MTTTGELLQRALELIRLGQIEGAIEAYREALRVDPESLEARFRLGALLMLQRRWPEAREAFEVIIRQRPNLAEAHYNLAGVLKDQGQLDGAVAELETALRLKPALFEAHLALANLRRDRGLFEAAVAGYFTALGYQPQSFDALNNLATTLRAMGRLDEAGAFCQRAVEVGPTYAEAHSNLGLIRHEQRRIDEAIVCYRQAIRLQPETFEVHNALGVALKDLGDQQGAADCFRRALQLSPQFAVARSNLGEVYRALGNDAEAIACYEEALRIDPNFVEAHNGLGAALHAQGRTAEALAAIEHAIALKPGFAEAHGNLGRIFHEQKRIAEAIACYREAIRLRPDLAGAHNALGAALHADLQHAKAMAAFERAIALKPDYAEALCNVGLLLGEEHQFAAALERFDQAEKIQPDLHLAHNNRAGVLLLTGDFAAGWPEYEWRWQIPGAPKRPPQPAWEGEPLNGRTVLLYAEQGLGDALQFIRYAPMVQACGGKVALVCDRRLISILSTCSGIDLFTSAYEPLPPFDVHAALLSLPRIFKTEVDSIPARVPYLSAPSDRVEHWRRELVGAGRLRVGINWQGNPSYVGDRRRSMLLAEFAPLAAIDGVHLVSLQKGAGAEQLAHALFDVEDLGRKLDEENAAFCDTAAVIKNLDLVITSDTALAHLAGALGAPVWVALAFTPDWRWLLDRSDSPWYPTMRLFRQSVAGQWQDVFARMVDELRRLAADALADRSPPNVA